MIKSPNGATFRPTTTSYNTVHAFPPPHAADPMIDALAKLCEVGGRLEAVSCALFGSERRFITALALRFEYLTATIRSVPNDDTLSAKIDTLEAEANEVLVDVAGCQPWAKCCGSGLRWAWVLTNQRGYSDGIRLEFGNPQQMESVLVELVVVASAIRIFSANAVADENQAALFNP